MKALVKWFGIIVILAMVFTALPVNHVYADTVVPVYVLDPSWDAVGGGGVFSAYIGPDAYDFVSPGSVGLFNGREAGIIKAGLNIDPTSGHYEDEGLFGFIPNVTIETLAAGPFSYDFSNQAGLLPVWVTIEIDTGVVNDRSDNKTYQYVPTTNPAGYHTVDATAGSWLLWADNNGTTTGSPMTLSQVAAANPGKNVVRAYLRLGMGDSYNNNGTGTIAWVDKVTIAGTTYDFQVQNWYVSPTGSDSALGTESDPFATIQHAIDVSTAGDTVNVTAGTYVLGSAITINKDITLNGVGNPLLQVSGTGYRIIMNSAGATLQGFWIEKTDKTGEQNIIYVGAKDLTIQNNKIWGRYVFNDPEVSRAMLFTGGLSGLLITNNEIYDLRQPAYISGVDTGTISNNLVYRTRGWVLEGGNLTFTGNKWGTGTNANVYDIAILSQVGPSYYTDVLAMSAANNNAIIEDQRYSPALLSSVYVDGAVAVSGDGTPQSPKKTVQEGILRVIPGGNVYVAAGTYSEALSITKSLHLIGANNTTTIIKAPASLPVATDINSAIISIVGTGVSAEINGFTISGPGPSGCGSIGYGIFVRSGANANIHDNKILDIRDNVDPLSGCQYGVAIFVGRNALSTTGTATITNNIIERYQKGAIVVDNTGSSATISSNTITGIGTTSITAQNGVQVGRGATATLTSNTISGNSFHLTGSGWDWGATGILIFETGNVTLGGGNNLSGNDNNLYIDTMTGPVTVGAEVFGSVTSPLTKGYQVVNSSSYPLDLTKVTMEGVNFSTATPEQILPFAGRIWDGLDDGVSGVALLKAGYQFVDQEGKIQTAINAAAAGDTVMVGAGTFTENLTISKALTLKGSASLATHVVGQIGITGSNVTIDGLDLSNPNQSYGILITGAPSNVTVRNSLIHNIGSSTATFNVKGIYFPGGADNILIENNSFDSILSQSYTAAAINSGDSNSTNGNAGVVIKNNSFTNITSGLKGAYGILLNNGAGATGVVIDHNTFSLLSGKWTHAIGLEGPTPGASVTYNTFSNLTTNPVNPDNAAIFFEANPNGASVVIDHNKFNSTGGVLIHPNDVTAYNYSVTATKNWWGTIVKSVIQTKIYGSVLFEPYYLDEAMTTLSGPIDTVYVDSSYTLSSCGGHLCGYDAFATIQEGINAVAPGGTVKVAAGTYDEQVILNKKVNLVGSGDTTVIKPSQTTANAFKLFDRYSGSAKLTAGILVTDTLEQVNVSKLKVDGSLVTSMPTGAELMLGVLSRGTPATFDTITVTSIMLDNSSGIYLSGYSTPVTMSVANCVISGYNKNGITANNPGLTANISGCAITGMGPTTALAQNGIQFGWDATGSVSGTTINSNYYTGTNGGTVDPASSPTADGAAGILLYMPGSGVELSGNTLNNNQFGIWSVAAPDVNIHDNIVTLTNKSGSTFPSGISVWSADQWTADFGGTEKATTGTVVNNTVNGHSYGILVRDYDTLNAAPNVTIADNVLNSNNVQVMATGLSVFDTAAVLSGNTFDKAVTVTHSSALLPAVWGAIQPAIDASVNGDTVNVAAGTYVGDLVIDKSISLLGPNASINPNTGTRSAEAILYPSTSNPDPAVCTNMAYLQVGGITIKGFTFDGDNPSLTSGLMIGGKDVDACEFLSSYEGVGSIVVENNILKNASYAGIDFYNYTNPAATSGNYIRYNLIQNIGSKTYGFGIGVLIYNNFYADITNNVFDAVRVGVQTGNFYQANPGTTGSISNNVINAWALGIFHNLWYSNASTISVSNNTINAVANPDATKWNGMLISSIGGAVNTTIDGNIINIPGTVSFAAPGYTAGYNVWNDTTTAPLTISGGTVTGGNYGAFVNNYEGYSSNADNTAITISGVTFNGSGTGVYVLDSPQNTNGATVKATLNGNIITGAQTGVKVAGNDATATGYHNQIVGSSLNDLASTSPTLLGFAENWWGSMFGPASISGNVNFIKWCGDAACSFLLPDDNNVITLGPGTVNIPGGMAVNQPNLTILLKNGTVVQNDNASCFDIHASYTTIEAESRLGAVCKPAAGKNGINVDGGLVNIVIKNLEFTGPGNDGIHFNGVVTDLMIVDNWIHNLAGNGINFTAQPAGVVSIQGNLFQNNAGNGIEAGSYTVPAEFNSWGNVNGAAAGDGISAGVDADPYTHVDLYVKPASVVPVGGQITYTVYGDFKNVTGASFTLKYPTSSLTFGSTTNLSGFVAAGPQMFTVDTTNGTITFDGTVPFGSPALSGVNLPIFSVVFTQKAGEGVMDLMESTDIFTMFPTTVKKPSTNIYAAALVDGYNTAYGYTVTGSVTMQGRSVYNGVPATLIGPLYNFYAVSLNVISNNLVFTGVAGGTYTFTTNQPRYLNVTADLGKTVVVSANRSLPDLELRGGNAYFDDRIDISDASVIGNNYKLSTFDPNADVNFDGKVDLGDFSLMGGNWHLTSTTAYASWLP